jgi:phage tail sheath gpL-like
VSTALTAFGQGTPGHLAAKRIYTQYPAAQIDFGAPTAGSTAATLDITATGSPSSDNAVEFSIMGRVIDVPWFASESADTFKTRAISYISAQVDNLSVTPSSGGSGITRLTFKVTGKIGNDCLVKAALVNAATSTEAVSGAATLTPLAGGTTDPDFTNIATAAGGKEYHYILLCVSNADAALASSSANAKRVRNIMNNLNTGLSAKLQQAIIGSTGSEASAKAGAVNVDSPIVQHINAPNALSLPCELGARELGGRLAAISLDPAANRIGEVLDDIFGSPNVIADNPAQATTEDAIGNGVTFVGYTASGDPFVIRPVTTYSVDANGATDRRCLDTQNVDGAYIVVRDIRDNIGAAFPKAKISKDAPSNSDPDVVEGVVEERDVKSWVVGRLRAWATAGVIVRERLEAAILDGSLVVQVDPADETQVNIVIPFKIVKGLAKIGVVGQRFN